MQGLQAHELAALVFQLQPGLPELGGERAGQMSNGRVGEEVNQNYGLERFQVAMRRDLKRRDLFEIREFQQGTEKDKRDGGRQVSPITGQQNGRNNDHQRIQEVKESINAAGDVHHGSREHQVDEDLGFGLGLVFAPQRLKEGKKDRYREPHHHDGHKGRGGNAVRGKVDNQQFNGHQKRDNDDTNFYKPCQP